MFNKKELCKTENKEGCKCNIGLPMEPSNRCACIFNFPDTAKEISETGFTNEVLKRTYANSHHWCNTHHFEWEFYELAEISKVVDRFFSKLHPAYDTSANSYC